MRETIESYFKGNYQAFYAKYLSKIKKAGGEEYQAPCPFHEDTKPSFNFNNETGKYYCHGCGKKGHAFHFYGRINGLDTKRDFRKILKGIAGDFGISWKEEKAHIEKTYDYTDETGNLLYQVVRMNPKAFRQRRPDGKGWIWNLNGTRRVLYRLPQVIGAQEVFVVEGEKDADALVEYLGLVATTNPMGARKWSEDYNRFLQGKDVVLISDNDIEGKEHMAQVGASLKGIVNSLKLLELPGLPSKGDISDWLAGFDDTTEAAEKLSVMIENAGQYEPPKRAILEDAVLLAQDFTTLEYPPKRKFLNPWLTEQSITLISGWRGTGKTWFVLSILDAVSRGESFGPWEAGEPVSCLFLDGEMPVQDVMDRIKDLKIERLYIYSDGYATSLGLPRANLLSETWRSSVKRILLTRGIKLFVLDNIASLAPGIDENSKKDWDPINTWLLELRFSDIATALLHHTNKEGGQRGTSGREDNIDNSIILKRPFDYTPDEGCRFIAHFSKARVRTQDLNLITDTEFQLREDESGKLVWTWGSVKGETKKDVLRMLDEGFEYVAIADAIGVTKGRISQVRKQAESDNLLTSNGKLTQSGFMFVHGLNGDERF